MRNKAACSNPVALAEIGLIEPDRGSQQRRIGLTPYNVQHLLNLRASDPVGFQAEMLQSFLPPATKLPHQWVWARRHDLPFARLMAKLPMPQFIRTLLSGRGSDTSTPALERMYPNTDVIIATAVCARHCSFCFREVGDPQGEASRTTGNMQAVMNAVHEVIRQKTPHVLVTGGDPLTRNNEQLQQMLTPLVESKRVEVLRLATRMVVDLPMRFFDQELLAMLSAFARQMKSRGALFRIVTHVNHPCELTAEALQAIWNIQQCGIEVLNQTVVLKGVNDDVETLRKLLMHLDRLGVRNHKLFHAMPVEGTDHLRIPLRRFRKLLAGLHQWLPGTSVPQANTATLVGKMPVSPSGRWMIPIPFTHFCLVRSFLGEWFFWKDGHDPRRHALEAGMALLLAVLGTFWGWPKSDQASPSSRTLIDRTVVVADSIGYPDYWVRQRFRPFVQDHVLYLPIQGVY